MRKQLLAIGLVIAHVGLASAQAPETSDPSGILVDGLNMPGAYPTRVTAANVDLTPSPGSEIDGAGEDVFRAEFPGAGPIAWTSPRMNAGDIALSIGPALPDNPLSYPSGDPGFQNNFQAIQANAGEFDPDSTDLTALAWRTSSFTGAHFAITRHNGVDNGYVLPGGGPLGTYHGIAYVSAGPARQGFGFGMDDGVFGNGNAGTTEVHLGHGGYGEDRHEVVFNFATAYFPYEAGWKGAWVNGAPDGEAEFNGASPDVSIEEVVWEDGLANVQLNGINSATDGMLFVAPSNGSSSSRIASAFPNASGGWTTTIRLDDTEDPEFYEEQGDAFQFLYIPYSATNLIGGHVDGEDGSMINSSGDNRFSLTRQEGGRYALSVFEADGTTKKGGNAGMLMLSVADTLPDISTLGSTAFMSYEFDEVSGDFIIESRELASINSPNAFDGFGNEFSPSNANFYFAWVDFQNPLSLDGLVGDFDGDGVLQVSDVDTLMQAVRDGSSNPTFDVNGSGGVDLADVNFWVADLKGTWMGDANLDGVFDSADLVAVFQRGEYEDGIAGNSTWATGDWNADGEFDSTDFVVAFTDGGYEVGPRGSVSAVPEPSTVVLMLLAALPFAFSRRR